MSSCRPFSEDTKLQELISYIDNNNPSYLKIVNVKVLNGGKRKLKRGGGVDDNTEPTKKEVVLCTGERPQEDDGDKGEKVAQIVFDHLSTKQGEPDMDAKYVLSALALASVRFRNIITPPDSFSKPETYQVEFEKQLPEGEEIKLLTRDKYKVFTPPRSGYYAGPDKYYLSDKQWTKAISITKDKYAEAYFDNIVSQLDKATSANIYFKNDDFSISVYLDDNNKVAFEVNSVNTATGGSMTYVGTDEVCDFIENLSDQDDPNDFFTILLNFIRSYKNNNLKQNAGNVVKTVYKKTQIKKHILGRDRCVYMLGRKQYVKVKGEFMPIALLGKERKK